MPTTDGSSRHWTGIKVSPSLHRVLICVCLLALTGCGSDSDSEQESTAVGESDTQPAQTGGSLAVNVRDQSDVTAKPLAVEFPTFREVHEELGLQFRFDNWRRGRNLMVESTGGGGAWLDFDADGYPDAVFAQGCDPAPDAEPGSLYDTLYRSRDAGSFENVTEQSRLGVESGYGQGVAIADYNNDGFDDIYITNVGSNRLLENLGDGTWIEVTDSASIDSPLWSSSAAWFDWDGDGDLDLFVCNYSDYDVTEPIQCQRDDGSPGVCHPKDVNGVRNCAFVNNGDGTFSESTDSLGLQGNVQDSKSLCVAIADLTGDGRPDVFVGNDTMANFLFVGQKSGQFVEQGVVLGCASSADGTFQATMGIALNDFDHNGQLDFYVTHFEDDYNTLYANQGDAGFADITGQSGLREPTIDYLAFGTVMYDFDQNGFQDLFVANGHIEDLSYVGESIDMRPQLFCFNGTKWSEAPAEAGPYFTSRVTGRSVSAGDFDLDGDLDLLVTHQQQDAAVLRNDSNRGHWLKLRLCGTTSNRNGIGAVVTVAQDETSQVSQIPGGTSYCATQEPVLTFGFGQNAGPVQVDIQWPSGRRQTLTVPKPDKSLTIVEPTDDSAIPLTSL